jgi:TolB-like protein/tetratricopeptide (TPR) repeat protein
MLPELLTASLSDRYRLKRELGAGGMATVWLADDVRHHRQVAVKVLREVLTASLAKERFLREITIAAGLTHPHIVPLHDSGEAAGQLFYVMPYVDGPSLRQKLLQGGELPITDAVRILRDVADAMAHAHKRGVVHRDLKPENVMLSERHALVTDFGVAKAVSEATGRQTLTTAGIALGTPAYMSPEQAMADPHADHRSDIYAFGVLAYEVLTGRTPFQGGSPQELLAAHVTTPAVPVAQYRATIPPALAALVMRCLEKKPADRPQRAEELIPSLEAVLTAGAGITPHHEAPQPETPDAARSSSVRWRRPLLITAAAVIAVASGAYAWWRIASPFAAAIQRDRVAVMRFENRTGVDSLETFGLILADVLTNDLNRSGVVSAVPTTIVNALVTSAKAAGFATTPAFVASETGSGLVVTGTYFRQGDSLAVQAEIIDAVHARMAAPIPLVTFLHDAPGRGIDTLRERVLVALSARMNPLLASSAVREIPLSLRAYRKYAEGWEHYTSGRYQQALRLFNKALVIDTGALSVRMMIALTEMNGSQNIRATDSVLRLIEPRLSEMQRQDRIDYDYLRAWTDGDLEGALSASRRRTVTLGRIVPVAAQDAQRANRLDEARRHLAELSRSELVRRTRVRFWEFQTLQLHHDADYHRELQEARRALREFGDNPALFIWEIRALAALGRSEELAEKLSALRVRDPGSAWLGRAAGELRFHGHHAPADTIGMAAVAWYRMQLAKDTGVGASLSSTKALRRQLAITHFDLGDETETAALFSALAREDSSDQVALGFLGALAAKRGDAASAELLVEKLERISAPYLFGAHVYWQGVIAATLGQCERAVAYFMDATRRGTPYTTYWDNALLSPIADCPAFKRFIRPR